MQRKLHQLLELLYYDKKGHSISIDGKKSLDCVPGSILKNFLKELKGMGISKSQYFLHRKLNKKVFSTTLCVAQLRENVALILGLE